jgi:hypothetical protein
MEMGTCKYCLRPDIPLVRSHLAPAALYDLCRAPDLEPIVVTAEVAMSSSRELKHPLLCAECDGSLSRDGEDWVLPLLATIDGEFPFYDILEKVPPDVVDGEIKVYAASRNPEIDVQKLAHFALAIFWKASVHSWRGNRTQPQIELGKYGDELRKFLRMEGPFPKYMSLHIGVPPPPVKQISFCQPYRGSVTEFHHFIFHVPGIQFTLSVGNRIGEAKETCFYSNPLHPIVVADISGDIRAIFQKVLTTAHKSRKLMKYLEQPARGQ